MTDDPRLAPLTEAFTAPGFSPDDMNEWRMTPRQLAAAILANLPQTQAERDMTALARVPEYWTIERYAGEWHVVKHGKCLGHGPTIEAAVNAALGDSDG